MYARSIFNELESQDKLKVGFWNVRGGILIAAADSFSRLKTRHSYLRLGEGRAGPVLFMFNIVLLFNFYGPLICIGVSSWRLRQRDYHGHGADDRGANLMGGLDFFYTLVLCQGVLYCFLLFLALSEIILQFNFSRQCKFLDVWGTNRVDAYLRDTRERCERDPAVLAAEEPSFLIHAVRLLESESQQDYLSGARMLYLLINDGEDAGSIILRSRPKIQRLLDMLVWTSRAGNTEIRMLAAAIVADLAGGIQLSQFPGAIRCVSSLLESTGQNPLWSNDQHQELSSAEIKCLYTACRNAEMEKNYRELISRITRTTKLETGDEGVVDGVEQNGNSTEEELGCNELILQGLRILEGLACDAHNCTDICGDPDILAKITAPLYSTSLIHDIGSSEPWADVVNGSLKVVRKLLIHATPRTSLRHEILSNEQAMSNLESILHLQSKAAEAVGQELQMRAMEILTQLVFHSSSVNIISEKRVKSLVNKQLEIFLPHGGEGTEDNKSKSEAADSKRTLKATAGETLVSILSKCDEATSMFITKEHDDVVDRLTGMLDAKCNIRYRILSANILENLCTRCNEHVNETLLQKVRKT